MIPYNNTDERQNAMEETKEMTFEAALARLEEIVRALENGQTKLEDSLALYEEGIRLSRLCNDRLDGAEQKIKLLQITPAAAENE